MSKNNSKTSAIESNVMSKIKSGQMAMRPKSYYVSISALIVAAVALLSFATVYLVSVLLFWLRIMLTDGPAYGAKRNLAASLETFPWWAVILGAMSLVGVIYLVKQYGHLYKVRPIYLLVMTVVLFSAIGFALSFSPLPGILNKSHESNPICRSGDINCDINGRMNGRDR